MEQKKITFNRDLNKAMKFASQKALVENSDFITPEHLLYGMMTLPQMQDLMWSCNEAFDLDNFLDELDEHIEESTKDDSQGAKPNDICEPSFQLQQVFTDAVRQAIMAERKAIDMPMAINAILCLENSWAAYLLRKHANVEDFEIMTATEIHFHERSTGVEEDDDQYSNGEGDNPFGLFDDDDEDLLFGDEDDFSSPSHKNDKWKKYVTCINEHLAEKNPLIGRERELDRTIQVLCRKDKNNPLHIGEPGVGKTALVYGVARRIEEGKVPDRLKGCNIYQLDMGTLLAGTRFRGDMEQRLKQIMEGVTSEAHCIIYLDEIHNIVGAGKGAEGGSDVSDLLKPYLDDDRIRVIGATTYTEYNKNFTRSVGMIRRFQTIDVEEPSIDEAIHILKSLKPIYEKYHHVKYDAAAIEYAVTSSAKFITDRFLPDKAIDIIDEAGAQAEMEGKKYKKIGKKQIAEVLAKVAKIDALAIKQDDNKNLASLESRMKDVIYGQDRAIQTVVEAVQLSKAGLTDENKPLASLLFVGPTGVGKTEVAKMLAQELGVKLVRFDMSEYVEKHTVAKLIGAPAGYVGYDDGGLLTDAVRKSPDCVLLLDEIEKAHSDIFNILLQVMDYGVLTDSKGRKAHFKNVILIMTSNAGAQYASQASVGFASTASAGSAMLKQVKHTFKPEFINRLNEIVVFNDMDEQMAKLILGKKLRELNAKLAAKSVSITLTDEAHQHLLKSGYSKEYGAREMDRVIQQQLKTMLMREILFGKLKKGGEATVDLQNGTLTIKQS
ncbi:MAG: AAA family ATPase [Bacteroidales bacterium]|nr:AAA family ATPase [Bacteroidales bacterium]MDY3291042.1 AAA family ATPase [Sodaliphilus sp.]MDD7052542.1 AAA family ATPase [Bacteroidales bacterium]MDY5205971.1 AAA family ATPase [Sodaliphilus sp.]MDY5226667.1 AAA family ATPase [Sodaliphilus sp.]